MSTPPEPSFLALIEAVLSLAAPPITRPKRAGTEAIKAGGYSDDVFTDITQEEKDEFECSICYQILRETMQCINKHKYCHSCIYVWSTSGVHLNRTRCPVCRTNGYYTRNQELDDRIGQKEVKCTMNGCKWTGQLLYLSSHKHTNYTGDSKSENKEGELPQIRRRATTHSRTGLQFPTRHLHLRSSLPSNNLNRGLNNVSLLSDTNNNNILSGRESVLSRDSRDSSEGVVHTPRPPLTPRPSLQGLRRVTSRPTLLNRDSPRPTNQTANSPTSPEPHVIEAPPRSRIQPSTRTQVSNNLTQIRERLTDSRSRLNSLMTTFGSELEQRQQEVFDINAERERHRQEQLEEVRDLGRRLGQVASELRRLLNQRSSIRGELNSLMDD